MGEGVLLPGLLFPAISLTVKTLTRKAGANQAVILSPAQQLPAASACRMIREGGKAYCPCFSADEKFDGTYPTNVVVTNEGHCTYIPPGIFKSTCLIDITWFPFDDQECGMKFGSWTYNGFKVRLANSLLRKVK